MKLCLLTIAVLLHTSLPPTNSQPHVIHKRFLWKSLAQLAQPFIRRPPPPPPQSYNNPYPPPPVFHVSPSAPQPIRVPPPSGQMYMPTPGHNNFPQFVQVPPSSYGSPTRPTYPQPPSYGAPPQQPSYGAPQPPSYAVPQPTYPQSTVGGAQWNPVATQSAGGPLFHGGMGSPVAPSNFQFQTPGAVSDVSLTNGFPLSALDLAGNGTKINLEDVLAAGGLSFGDLTATMNAASESTKISVTDPPAVELSITDGPALFMSEKGTSVPSDYIRVVLPDDIMRELRKRVSVKELNDQGILLRNDLLETYLAPSTSSAARPPFGLVSVQMSSQALEFLNEYAQIQSSNNNGPQLELPRSVLEQLSKDSSQRVRLIDGRRETLVKTGSNDVFIAPSDQKPPDGYVSIPLSDSAMSELRKSFLGTRISSQDVEQGIPVRVYIAPADMKLPAGHMTIPLPDSILDSVKGLNPGGRSSDEPAAPKSSSAVLRESDTAIYLAPSRKLAPSSFRKLKLPEIIMESLRQAISATRLADSGTPAKDLTAAYLASTNEFVPPGFLSISVPDTLVKMLEVFSETEDVKQSEDVVKETGKSTDRTKERGNSDSRDLGGEDGPNLTRKIVDALIEAIKRTVKQVVKNTRDEEKKEKESKGKNRGKNKNKSKNRKESGSSSRDNARTTKGDANNNDFYEDDEEEENIDMYQPQYQMSPFFPATISTYPYVDPYQYAGLWTYGDPNQWTVAGNPSYADYVGAQNGGQDGAVQYQLDQQFDAANLEKRQGETQKEIQGEIQKQIQGETQKQIQGETQKEIQDETQKEIQEESQKELSR